MNESQNNHLEPETNRSEGPSAQSQTNNTAAESENDSSPASKETKEVPASSTPAETTQAFKWTYTDANGNEETSDKTEPSTEKTGEKSDVKEEEKATQKTLESSTEAKSSEPQRKKRSLALGAACILSAVSIFLLLTFSFSVFLGLIPITPTYTPNTNNTPTSPEEDASPALIEDFLNSVVIVKGTGITSISTGTGVIISADGYIITNYHVIEGCNSVTVELYGEDTAQKAQVVGYHEDDDVAVLKISRTGLRAATFVDSNAVRYGEKVYAIGTPEGAEYGWSVTQGIVSCPNRQLMIYDDEGVLEKKMNVVQTDASVNHGNSGGPIINVRGEIVGIVTLKRTDSVGMGFALPANGVLIDAEAIIKNGNANGVDSGISMPRPLLGITGVGVVEGTFYESFSNKDGSGVTIVDEDYAKKNPQTTFYAAKTGVYVSATSAGADAAKHMQKGDIITEINGNPVATIYQVMSIINEYNGGDTVDVTYYRAGKYNTVTVELRSAAE